MTTEIGAVAESLSAQQAASSFEWFLSGCSSSLSPSSQLDNGFINEDGSPSPLCCGHDGGRRFFGPAGRLNYISIHHTPCSSNLGDIISI